MAEPAAQPRGPLDDAVEHLSRRGDGIAGDVILRDDAVEDAFALAAATIGATVRAPDPESEAGMGAEDAVAAASGLMTWRTPLGPKWWTAGTGPYVVRTPSGPAVVVPGGRRSELIDAHSRRVRPLDARAAKDVEGPAIALAHELPDDTRWWRLMLWALGRRRSDVWLLLALGLVGGVTGLYLPFATAAIFESAVPSGDAARVAGILAAFAVASLAIGILLLVRGLLVVRIRDRSDAVLAPALAARMLRLRVAFFRSRTDGDIVNRVLSVDAARQQVDDNTLAALVTSAFGLVNLVFLLLADPVVGVVSAIATFIALGVTVTVQLRARGLLPPLLEARSRSDATLLSLLGSLVSWRVVGAEDRALARWAIDQGHSTSAMRARLRAISLTGPVDVAGPVSVLVAFVAAVALFPGSSLQPGSTSAPGVFVALYTAVAQLSIAMTVLGYQLIALSELGPILSRMHPIAVEPVERAAESRSPGVLGGAMGLSQVVFGYRHDHAPILEGVTLSVAPGEFVAVVGPSGGGKSTIMRLLLGFDEPWAGQVTFDGRDLAGLDPTAVRRQLGVVLQASRPLGETIRESVAGQRCLDDDEVWDLLERAGLADDVSRMPEGLAAPVGDHGSLLSGGQRQRLMIATALAGRPRILLLDEATSALDNVTQGVVMRTILSSTATRLVVAHRMTTVRGADRVVVIADGGIAEAGRPEDLLAAGGHFARLAARQEV